MSEYNHTEEQTFRTNLIATLDRIESQTIKTNGRVSKLERWQSYVLGGLSVITLMVVPIIIYILTTAL